jgi:transposase-like protein
MSEKLLSTLDTARRLGISRASLYDWLDQANAGQFMLGCQPATFEYLERSRQGRGRIRIETKELERIKDLKRVRRCPALLDSAGSTPIRASESLSNGVTA